jgi:hypothetical protein
MELTPSVVHTGELPKDLWIDWKKISAGNQKRPLWLIKGTERSLRPGGRAETLSRQRWCLQPVLSSVGFRGFCPLRKGKNLLRRSGVCYSGQRCTNWFCILHSKPLQHLLYVLTLRQCQFVIFLVSYYSDTKDFLCNSQILHRK